MKKLRFNLLLLLLLVQVLQVFGQRDSITRLDEVVLSDVKLYKNSRGQKVTVLSDSTLTENEPLLTSLLRFNTPIYFKENGYGMVSSASFRGTTASQTAVVWNGININSQFNGQTDFNTITTANFDNVAVRAGGGSVLYGSGAIGGSVHLNNKFRFDGGFRNRLRFEYGSFNTFLSQYKGDYSSDKSNVQLSIVRHSSDNDYPYLGTEKSNQNGDFYNTGVSLGIAHILDDRNTIKFYSNYYDGERAFSGTLTAPSRSKYTDENSRNLLEWKSFYNQFTSSLKLAYLDGNYRYYENRQSDNYDYGRTKTGIAKYDLKIRLSEGITINGILDYQHTNGEGSNVGINRRNIGGLALLFNHELGRFGYEVSGRKEVSDRYESPMLFSFGAGYAVTDFYNLKLNFSKNFRIPTYNDLFWRAGGNIDLKPEESYQAEFGQIFHFSGFEFSLTGFLIKIDNLLRWVPDSNGLWRPVNTQSVLNKGLEANISWRKIMGDHQVSFNGLYAYTKTNDEILGKELIYVPKHKANASAGYAFRRLSFYYQFLYNGSIFTSSDNNYELEGYKVSNAGINYNFGRNKEIRVGIEVRNLWNTNYQNLPSRPMPGRSISSSLTFNF
jgi:iron complex outermembrane receptor protein